MIYIYTGETELTGIGIFSWFSYQLPIEERLMLIKNAGFDAVSLWWGGEDNRKKQHETARKLGLQIDNIHAPFPNANEIWIDCPGGDDYIAMLISCVNDCAMYDIPTTVIHTSRFSEPVGISELGLARIKKLVEAAENKRIKLAFENLNSLQHLDYIFGSIKSEYLGFCYDSGHENCNHPDANCLSLYGDKLFAVHIDDNFGDSDTHLLPFDGLIDWAGTINKLKKCRAIDFLTLEVDFNPQHEKSKIYNNLTAEEYIRTAYERAVILLRMLNLP